MLTIHKVVTSIGYYLTGVAKAVARNYYRDTSISCEWYGSAAKPWGYVGEPVAATYDRMLQGFTADGRTKLTQNAGSPDRYPGPDLTFSANKDVSLAWGLERGATARRNIEQYGLMGATKDALTFAEQHGLFTRRGAGGAVTERAVGMVSCLFLHGLSRPPAVSAPGLEPLPEPQLHVHAATGNMCLRMDGTSGTILAITATKEDARNKRSHQSRSALHALRDDIGRVFSHSLRTRMEHLGYQTADVANSKHGFWTIVGIPEKLVRDFSSRHREILEDLERRGVSGGKEANLSARRTRSPKKAASLADLFVSWRERANGFDPATIRVREAVLHGASPAVPRELRERAEAKAALHVVARPPREQTASVSNGATNQRAARPASKHNAPTNEQRKEERQVEVVHDDHKTLRAAAAVARILKSLRRKRSTVITRANLWAATKQVEYLGRTKFTPDEKAALATITRSRGAVQFLGAEVSATKVLSAAQVSWRRQGIRTLYATDSRRAAAQFERNTGLHSITTAGLLRGLSGERRGLLAGYDIALKKSLSLGLGFRSGGIINYALKAAAGKWLSLDSKTVLVVESSSLQISERADILKKVAKAGAKIVWVDRTKQATQISEQLVRPRREPKEMQRRHEREREQEQEQSR